MGESTQFKIFGMLLFGFGVLVALFPFHGLPEVTKLLPLRFPCSMPVLKKFGLYGLSKSRTSSSRGSLAWSPYLLGLPWAMLIRRLCDSGPTNLKSMVGNGSVMHMGYCFLELGFVPLWGRRCRHADGCSWLIGFINVSVVPIRLSEKRDLK